jgi:hypothetical protein
MVGISQVQSVIEEMPDLEILCKTPLTMGDGVKAGYALFYREQTTRSGKT